MCQEDVMFQCGEEEHSLVHYWYTAWPDHKAPNTARQLLDLVQIVHAHQRTVPGPIVVHCRLVWIGVIAQVKPQSWYSTVCYYC